MASAGEVQHNDTHTRPAPTKKEKMNNGCFATPVKPAMIGHALQSNTTDRYEEQPRRPPHPHSEEPPPRPGAWDLHQLATTRDLDRHSGYPAPLTSRLLQKSIHNLDKKGLVLNSVTPVAPDLERQSATAASRVLNYRPGERRYAAIQPSEMPNPKPPHKPTPTTRERTTHEQVRHFQFPNHLQQPTMKSHRLARRYCLQLGTSGVVAVSPPPTLFK